MSAIVASTDAQARRTRTPAKRGTSLSSTPIQYGPNVLVRGLMASVMISDRELYGVCEYLAGPVWGGPQLQAQDELWKAIDHKRRFAAVKPGENNTVDVAPLSTKPAALKLSADAIELLKSILSRPGQPRAMGQLSAAALVRIG